MTPKQYLSQARYIDRRIEARIAERDRLLDSVTAARSSQLTGMPRGNGHDWTDTVDRAADMTAHIDEDIRRLIALKREIWDAIDAVEDLRLRTVLELYYRAGYNWEQVAGRMHYDVRYIFKLHGLALTKVRVPGHGTEEGGKR